MTEIQQIYETGLNLSEMQRHAIEMLLSGKRPVEVAKVLKISRQTLFDWRNANPDFIAEMNAARVELWQASRERLRALVGEALAILSDDLLNGETKNLRQNAAVHVLKCAGVYGHAVAPSGPVTAEAVQKQWDSEQQAAELVDLLNELGAGI